MFVWNITIAIAIANAYASIFILRVMHDRMNFLCSTLRMLCSRCENTSFSISFLLNAIAGGYNSAKLPLPISNCACVCECFWKWANAPIHQISKRLHSKYGVLVFHFQKYGNVFYIGIMLRFNGFTMSHSPFDTKHPHNYLTIPIDTISNHI